MKKLPHALKSRLLTTAYSDSAPKVDSVRRPAWPMIPGVRDSASARNGRDEDAPR